MKRGKLFGKFSPVLLLILVLSMAGGLAMPVRASDRVLPVGAYITFGTYPQNGEDDPLQWIVLRCEDGNALITTRYGIDCVPFHDRNGKITWAESDLREWLNSDFYDTAFTASEQQQIQDTFLLSEDSARYDVSGGEDTLDKIFIQSYTEFDLCFPKKEDRICRPTAYALEQDAYENPKTGGCWFVLRTPGQNEKYMMCTNSDGSYDYDGVKAAEEGGCVRPTMWIRIS